MIKEKKKWDQLPAFKRLWLGVSCLVLSSCATVTKGTHDTIQVITEPPGGRAYTDILSKQSSSGADYIGCEPTPCSFRLPRRKEAVILIEHHAFAPYEAAVFSENRGERKYRAKQRAKAAKKKSGKNDWTEKDAMLGPGASPEAGTAQPLGQAEGSKDNLLRGNVALSSGASAGILSAAAIAETGTVIVAPVVPSLMIGGGIALYGVASFTLAADTTDAMTGANNSLYPNPLRVRLSKDPNAYSQDPNVIGVRQRRKTPSPKPPLPRGPSKKVTP